MMRKLRDILADHMEDSAFRKAWEEVKREHEIATAIVELRKQKGWSQAYLAERLQTGQSVISRIEVAIII